MNERRKSSDYMRWAKLASPARFNLATSGLTSISSSEFPFSSGQWEITAPGSYGYPPLQERIAAHAGVPVECVVAAAGTSMANHLAMAAILEAGDEVLIEHPTYGLLLDAASYLGASIRRFHRRFENDFAIDLDELAANITPRTRLIVITNLHNPSGALTSDPTLRALADIARNAGAHLLVDEVYIEMLFGRAPSAFHLAEVSNNPFVVTNSLTKTYGLSGLRCGWIVASPELAARMWALNDLFGVNAAHPAEQLSVLAFDRLSDFAARAKQRLTTNRRVLDQFLDRNADIECVRPPGGSVVFPRLRSGDSEQFVRRLRDEYEVSVVPGRFFEMPQHFRIGIGGDTTELTQGLELIREALRSRVP